jgi:type VI secretion system protein ImpC
VELRPVRGKPGWFEVVAYLRPDFQLEYSGTPMRLVAEVPMRG